MIFKNYIAMKKDTSFVNIRQHFLYKVSNSFDIVDHQLTSFVNKHGLNILRLSLAVVFVWFGLLKVLNASPVTSLAENIIPGDSTEIFLFVLGIIEIGIGVALILKTLFRVAIAVLVMHLVSTFSLLIILEDTMINDNNPFLLTLEGEFIIKNLVLIAGVLTIASAIGTTKSSKKEQSKGIIKKYNKMDHIDL